MCNPQTLQSHDNSTFTAVVPLLAAMVDNYKLITVTHKNLNVEDLEHFIVRHNDDKDLASQLEDLASRFGQDEVLYLATCNRVIFIFYGHKAFDKRHAVQLFQYLNPSFAQGNSLNLDKVIEYCDGIEAVNRIYEVAASIDSLVVGEREIFRQFRAAYDFSKKHKLSGDNLRILERCTVKAAKDVYTHTEIGAKPVSVASLSIQSFLKRKINTSDTILMVGAGETNRTIGRFLKKYGYSNLIIFNRSLDNAKELSDELGAEARHLADLKDFNAPFSALFACTASQEPIITSELWYTIKPSYNSNLIVDLSIPHNVSQEVASLEEVDYISIDTIRGLADENLKYRSGNVAAARMILREHLDEFVNMYERRKVERAFSKLPSEIRDVKERALELVYKEKIAAMPADAQQLIAEIASYMEKKCVAVPMKLAKEVVDEA